VFREEASVLDGPDDLDVELPVDIVSVFPDPEIPEVISSLIIRMLREANPSDSFSLSMRLYPCLFTLSASPLGSRPRGPQLLCQGLLLDITESIHVLDFFELSQLHLFATEVSIERRPFFTFRQNQHYKLPPSLSTTTAVWGQ